MYIYQYFIIISVFLVLICMGKEINEYNSSLLHEEQSTLTLLPKRIDSFNNDKNLTEIVEYTTKIANNTMIKRRLRKRKRRPQKMRNNNIENVNFNNNNNNNTPKSLDPVQQVWDVMEFESFNKPYNRRRLTPKYYSNKQETTVTTTTAAYFEEIRNPYSALKEIDDKVKSRTTLLNTNNSSDLRSVLKKSEGTLSLSEILQKQNLTLHDLLKGGSNAISALTQATNTNKIINNKRKYPDNRIQNVSNQNETATTTASNTIAKSTTTKYDSYRKIKSKLPITSAKLLKTKQTTEKNFVEQLPPKAVQIKLNDIFGFSDVLPSNNNNNREDNDGPLKMVIDLDKMMDKTTTTAKYIQDKLKIKTAKEEILEFVNDEVNKVNITDVLESRNMTLDELIQLRERGANQGRLLDIFRNANEKNLINENDDAYVKNVKNLFEATSIIIGRRPKNIEFNNNADTRFTKSITENPDVKPSINEYTVTSFPVYKIESNNVQYPYWKSIYPALMQRNSQDRTNKEDDLKGNSIVQEKVPQQIEILQENANVLEEEDNLEFDSKLNTVVSKLNVDLEEESLLKREQDIDEDDDEELFNWPRGVKSALVASFAIIAASLLIFLSILIICKLTQKTKRNLCYGKNLIADNRIKTPILNDEPKRTIRTIMCDTLGRKKINYWRSMHNVPDTIWDNNRIPFQ